MEDLDWQNKKAVVKRTMAHEVRFREEKQQILESLGGSRAEIVNPSADDRIQRKLTKESGSTASSSSSRSGFRASDDRPEQPTQSDDIPMALDHSEEQSGYDMEERRQRGIKSNKKTWFIALAVVLALAAIGVIVAVIVVLANRAGTSSPSTSGAATVSSAPDDLGICTLDRQALAQCENGVLAVPACAADTYQELIDTYSGLLVGTEQKCDAAHQGLVALAVAQTNHGHDAVEPITFFVMSNLYFALEGTRWQDDTNWLQGPSPCSGLWYGISCSSKGSISISLEQNDLQGSLPTELGLLRSLETLEIWRNGISGSLPSEIGLLMKLQTLDFHLTLIHSELPSEIGMLTELSKFSVSNAPLTGPIPSEIGNMSKLGKALQLPISPNRTPHYVFVFLLSTHII